MPVNLQERQQFLPLKTDGLKTLQPNMNKDFRLS
jgi:hypothetical protein